MRRIAIGQQNDYIDRQTIFVGIRLVLDQLRERAALHAHASGTFERTDKMLVTDCQTIHNDDMMIPVMIPLHESASFRSDHSA
jgi:hypothetical protein